MAAAKKQTAIALRAVATRAEFPYLARLGDFESARKLAGNASMARYVTQDALQRDDLATAERQIKLMGSLYQVTGLWLQLSKRYHALNRPADARRTAYYAVSQVRREKNTYQWGEVAEWLCEINEQPTARRLIAIAQQELINPRNPSPQDYVLTTAARCGFDDIALKGPFGSAGGSLISIYALKNRDDIARQLIDTSLNEKEAELQKLLAAAKPENKPLLNYSRSTLHAGYLAAIARAQISRGDLPSASITYREVNTLFDLDKSNPSWLSGKTILIRECEQSTQWELANEMEATLQTQIQKRLATPLATEDKAATRPYGMTPSEAAELLERTRIMGFKVLFNPDKFSRKQRLAAMARVRPRAEKYAIAHPENKAGMYLGIARGQRLLNDAHWRATLQFAQAAAFEAARQGRGWYTLQLIAAEWQRAGDTKSAHSVGSHTLKQWESWSVSRLSALNRADKHTQIELTDVIKAMSPIAAETLIYSDMPKEAIGLIMQNRPQSDFEMARIIALCAGQHPGAPPQQLLALPKAQRREALKNWTDGLVPEPVYVDEENSSAATQLFAKMFW